MIATSDTGSSRKRRRDQPAVARLPRRAAAVSCTFDMVPETVDHLDEVGLRRVFGCFPCGVIAVCAMVDDQPVAWRPARSRRLTRANPNRRRRNRPRHTRDHPAHTPHRPADPEHRRCFTVAGSAGWSLDEDDRCGYVVRSRRWRRSRVVLTGDPNGDGYLVFAAQAATPRLVAFAVRHTSGYLRVALPGAECERLHCRPCVTETPRIACRSTFAAPAPESRRAIAPGPSRHWLRPPPSPPIPTSGHVVPVQAQADGVLGRRDPPRRPSTWPAWRNGGRPPRSARSSRPIIPSRWRTTPSRSNSPSNTDWPWSRSGSWWRIAGGSSPRCPVYGSDAAHLAGASRVIGFRDVYDLGEHLAVIVGAVGAGVPVPLHVHIECLTGDVFGSTACRCGEELNGALARMSAQGSGVVLYLRPPGPAQACGLFARGDAATDVMPETVTWILRDLGVYAIRLSDDVPGFGLVMFGRSEKPARWRPQVEPSRPGRQGRDRYWGGRRNRSGGCPATRRRGLPCAVRGHRW
ncbi:riboflavin biosynthesis protein RibA [Mycobacterium tuberculosis variant africanum]|nr:riboflavin biosynthesis protein RibA [Mycobacterium tuberculosis variant africanum]